MDAQAGKERERSRCRGGDRFDFRVFAGEIACPSSYSSKHHEDQLPVP